MRLKVSTAAQKYIMMKGGVATANLKRKTKSGPYGTAEVSGKPFVRLGQPDKESWTEYREIEIHPQVKIYLDINLLNLDDSYSPEIVVQWSLLGKRLAIKGI